MEGENGNGRLLARVDERTEAMQREFNDFRSEMREAFKAHVKSHEMIDDCIGNLQVEQGKLDERIGTANRWQAAYTTIAALIAGALGQR